MGSNIGSPRENTMVPPAKNQVTQEVGECVGISMPDFATICWHCWYLRQRQIGSLSRGRFKKRESQREENREREREREFELA